MTPKNLGDPHLVAKPPEAATQFPLRLKGSARVIFNMRGDLQNMLPRGGLVTNTIAFMKFIIALIAYAALLITVSNAALLSPAISTNQPLDAKSISAQVLPPQVKDRGEHYRVWQTTKIITNKAAGVPTIQVITNEYHELGSGICYQKGDGSWADSKVELTIAPDGGAQALERANKIHFNSDIYSEGAVRLILNDGQKISATFRGLFLHQSGSDKRVLVSPITNSIGIILPPNRLVYSNCFVGLKGDLVLTVTPAGLEQDVVVRESLADISLTDLGLDPKSTLLEAWTEFFEVPTPSIRTNTIAALPTARGEIKASALEDESVDFGALYMREGRAFSTRAADSAVRLNGSVPTSDSVPVGKRWRTYENGTRRFLIESVRWNQMLPHFERLNVPSGSLTNAAASPRFRVGDLPSVPLPSKLMASAVKRPVQVAANAVQVPPAFVIDFTLDQNTYPSFTFEPNVTYYVSHPVTINQAVLKGGTVIKMADSTTAAGITITGTLTCDTGPGRTAIVTSKNDNSVGEWISGSSGVIGVSKYGSPALTFSYNAAKADLKYVRISHAGQAVYFGNSAQANSANNANKVRHSQFVNCWTGIVGDTTWVTVHNCLFHAMDQLFEANFCTIHCEHITGHNSFLLGFDWWGGTSHITLVNSILVAVEDNALDYTLESPSVWYPYEEPLFQTSINGSHYLVDGSNLRGAGVSSIDSTLRTELWQKTTHPPVLLPGGSLVSLRLDSHVPRNDGVHADLGFAYDPLDYIASGLYMQGGTLVVTNGVVVGVNAQAGQGVYVGSGAKIASGSDPINLNRFVELQSVQEQTPASPVSFFTTFSQEYGSSPSEIRLRFTELCGRAGYNWHLYQNGGAGIVAIRDCQIFDGGIGGVFSTEYDTTMALTNNVFEFSKISIPGSSFTHAQFWNNTFIKGSLTLSGANYTWGAQANLFDQVILSGPSFYTAYNAYYQTTPLSGSGNVLLYSPVNYPVPGKWYLPSGSTPLLNGGGRSPSIAGLYHHTTQVDQAPEGSKAEGVNIDIGFHYVAVNTGNLPIDSDGDGLSNLTEDIDGDGIKDPGETNFADADTDYDGRNDGDELFRDKTDPLNSADGNPVQLGDWRFDDETWVGSDGQQPSAAVGIQQVASWSGSAQQINPQSAGRLTYRSVEPNGSPNINLRQGTLHFWFRPNWQTGFGPGAVARLIESGTFGSASDGWWALSVNASGSAVLFQSQLNGATTTYIDQPIQWIAGEWHEIALTYSPAATKLYVDGELAASGAGIQNYPTAAARQAYGFSIGSSRSGTAICDGRLDEFQTYNFALDADDVLASFQARIASDQDNDGLSDIRENERGTNPLDMDSDDDGLMDGPEVLTHNSNPLNPDSDYDGRSDEQEINRDATNPTDFNSVLHTNLALWAFNQPDLAGGRGELPKDKVNVTTVPSWSGKSADIEGQGASKLVYSEYEPDGTCNYLLRAGTFQFWFKPSWNSGTAPVHDMTLFEIGERFDYVDNWFALAVDPGGSYMQMDSPSVLVSIPISFTAGQWNLITVTFDIGQTALYLNGTYVGSDWGMSEFDYPNALARSQGLRIGSAGDGGLKAEGEFEDFMTFNYPKTSTEIASEYQRLTDIKHHTVLVPDVMNATSANVEVIASPSASVAWLLNSQNFASATWNSAGDFEVTGLQEGQNVLWVGFRSLGQQDFWIRRRITVDTAPPQITILNPVMTNPNGTPISIPLIQLQGYANESLSSVSFSLENVLGSHVNEPGVIRTARSVAGGGIQVDFQCFDIDLDAGENHIFLTVRDQAGNATIQEIVYIRDYTGVTTGPTILSQWPNDGTKIAATSFTLRGRISDPTATVRASVTAGDSTTEVEGIIERDGLFWIENLPVASGNNQVTLVAENAAGFDTTISFTVVGSDVRIVIAAVEDSVLKQKFANLQGTINDTSYSVWINGVRASVDGNGAWNADAVPLNEGGTATFHVKGIPNSDNNGNGNEIPQAAATLDNVASPDNPSSDQEVAATSDAEKPFYIDIKSYTHYSYGQSNWDPCGEDKVHTTEVRSDTANWDREDGGGQTILSTVDRCEINPDTGLRELETYHNGVEYRWYPNGESDGRHMQLDGTWSGWGDPGSGGILGPALDPWVHYDFADTFCSENGECEDYGLNARTVVELHTGGKSIAKEANLFTIQAGITPWDVPHFQSTSGRAQEITAGGLGKLGNDGYLYTLLQNGQTLEATVKAKGVQDYQYNVSALAKHKFKISANGTDLLSPPVPPLTEFCVGQHVFLRAYFEPPLVKHKKTRESQWSVGGTFINRIVKREPPKSWLYQNDPTLLFEPNVFRPSARIWWYNKGESAISAVWRDIEFQNGQKIGAISAAGKVTIYRPTVGGFGFRSPRSFLLTSDAFSYGDDNADQNTLYWWAMLDSKYPGTKSVTQKINGTFYATVAGRQQDIGSTLLDSWLDTGEHYIQETYRPNEPGSFRYDFKDSPAIYLSWATIGADINANFECYIRFRPSVGIEDNNIFVTLGKVDWHCRGRWHWIEGISINETPEPGPLHESNDFPTWERILILNQ